MKKMSAFFPVIILFTIIGLWFYEAKNTKITVNKKIDKHEEVSSKFIRSKQIVVSFISDNEKFLDKDYFDKILLKKDDKKVKFSSLTEITKATVKLQKFKSIRNDFKKILTEVELEQESKEKSSAFFSKVNYLIDKEIEKLYKIFGSSIHPMDKMFLDKFHD